MKKILLITNAFSLILLFVGCEKKDDSNRTAKQTLQECLDNMIDGKEIESFLTIGGYGGMNENNKFYLKNDIAFYTYQYMKYSINDALKIDDGNYVFSVTITSIDFNSVSDNYCSIAKSPTGLDKKTLKEAIDLSKDDTITNSISIKVELEETMSGMYRIYIDQSFFDAVLPNYLKFMALETYY